MSYHMTNVGASIHPFADVCGFVPEAGDNEEDFNYANKTIENWKDWCRQASKYSERLRKG